MSDRVIRLHVGAHKTATTYIQDTLACNRDASAGAGVAYWPRETVRPLVNAMIRQRKEAPRSTLARAKAYFSPSENDPVARLRDLFSGRFDVTISDENLLGEAKDSFEEALYLNARAQLITLKAALPETRLEILVALRSYDAFLSSLYAETLRNGAMIRPEDAKSAQARVAGEWPRLIAEIRDTFPNARLVVWRYEDFGHLENDILARLSGLDGASLNKRDSAQATLNPSIKAIETYVRDAPQMNWVDRMVHMRALIARHPQTDPSSRFTLWTAEEAATLSQRYAQDVETIKSRDDVEFLA
ncbi:MAG: hypothetical protein AAF692_13195 [Pseudomonadota bacterium]